MVHKNPTQQFVIVLSALLFLGTAWVAIARQSLTASTQPDPLATYGTLGK